MPGLPSFLESPSIIDDSLLSDTHPVRNDAFIQSLTAHGIIPYSTSPIVSTASNSSIYGQITTEHITDLNTISEDVVNGLAINGETTNSNTTNGALTNGCTDYENMADGLMTNGNGLNGITTNGAANNGGNDDEFTANGDAFNMNGLDSIEMADFSFDSESTFQSALDDPTPWLRLPESFLIAKDNRFSESMMDTFLEVLNTPFFFYGSFMFPSVLKGVLQSYTQLRYIAQYMCPATLYGFERFHTFHSDLAGIVASDDPTTAVQGHIVFGLSAEEEDLLDEFESSLFEKLDEEVEVVLANESIQVVPVKLYAWKLDLSLLVDHFFLKWTPEQFLTSKTYAIAHSCYKTEEDELVEYRRAVEERQNLYNMTEAEVNNFAEVRD